MDILRKGLLASIGAVVLTQKKVQEVTEQFIKQGKLSTKQADDLVAELVSSGQAQWEEMEDSFLNAVDKAADSLGFVRQSQLEALEKRIAELEKEKNREE